MSNRLPFYCYGFAVFEIQVPKYSQRSLGITETTWHRFKNTYGGMKPTDAKRRNGTRGRELRD